MKSNMKSITDFIVGNAFSFVRFQIKHTNITITTKGVKKINDLLEK